MRAFGYTRVSSDGQEDGTSLDEQKARIEAFCVARGWRTIQIFRDVASGTTFDRPEFQKLQAKVASGDVIVVLALSRLSRTLTDGYPQILAWQERNIAIYSASEPVETGSAMGRHLLRMTFDFAQTEREVLLERIAAGRKRNAERGGWNGGRVPFGYLRAEDGGHAFIPEESEAATVKQLFKLYATGRFGLTKLRKATGCSLSESAIGELLSNPFYTGRVRYAGIVKPNAHAALISPVLFARVQRVRAERAARSPEAKAPEVLAEMPPPHPDR
jgi:site-specific DNA recombinase